MVIIIIFDSSPCPLRSFRIVKCISIGILLITTRQRTSAYAIVSLTVYTSYSTMIFKIELIPCVTFYLLFVVLAPQSTSFQPWITAVRSKITSFTMRPLMMNNNGAVETEATIGHETTLLDFPEDIWEVYVKIMTEVMESTRVLKKEKAESVKAVQDYLISKSSLKNIPCPMQMKRQKVQRTMVKQSQLFQTHYKFSQSQYNFALRSLVYFGDTCAKRRLGPIVAISWHKLKEAGMIPRENSISTYMFILSDAEKANPTICAQALDEVATFHDLAYAPNEKTIFLRIKSMISKDDVAGAEAILHSLPDKGQGGEWKRLRTFQPVLDYYSNLGDASSILRLLRDMRKSPGVIVDADAYALIIGSLAKYGYFRCDSSPIDGYQDYGFTNSHGPKLLDELSENMGEDILELSEAAARRIMTDFLIGFEGSASKNETEQLSFISASNGLNIGRVDIEHATGHCLMSGAKLRLFRLDEEQRQHVHDTLLEMARLSYRDFSKKRNKAQNDEDDDYGFEQLQIFSEWLDNREGEPFTAVVDGANVAYFGSPELHYSQVLRLVEKLKEMGENPLVVVPKKYTQRKFVLSSTGQSQILDDRNFGVLESLEADGVLYKVPPRCLDDYFWMLASVSNQTVSRNVEELQVAPENTAGRFPGLRPMLITNDQMRDHKLDLLEPREFRRWRSSHILSYNITPYSDNEWEDGRTIELSPADFFSKEIQGNLHGNGRSTVWHFPVSEWESPGARFCVWIDDEADNH